MADSMHTGLILLAMHSPQRSGGGCLSSSCVASTFSFRLYPLEETSDEHKVGASMFNHTQYLFEMHTMKRFQDPVLISTLQKMRHAGGKKLLDDEWQALLNTELDAEQLERDPEIFLFEHNFSNLQHEQLISVPL